MIMENLETILEELEKFDKKGGDVVSKTLENYVRHVARTGDTLFPWHRIRHFMRHLLQTVMTEFYETCGGGEDVSESGNIPAFSFATTRDKLLHHFDTFTGAPFTIQRLCEIMVDPTRHYKRTDKFLRGLEKNVLVVSIVEPGRQRRGEDPQQTLLNGLQEGGLHPSPLMGLPSPPVPSPHHHVPKRLSLTQTTNSVMNNSSGSYGAELNDSENDVASSNGPSSEDRDGEEAMEGYNGQDEEEDGGEGGNERSADPAEPPTKRLRLEGSFEGRLKEETCKETFEPGLPEPMEVGKSGIGRDESEEEGSRVEEGTTEEEAKKAAEENVRKKEVKNQAEVKEEPTESEKTCKGKEECRDSTSVAGGSQVPDNTSGEAETSEGDTVETSERQEKVERETKLKEKSVKGEVQDPLSSASSEICSSNSPQKSSEGSVEDLSGDRGSEGSPDSAESAKELISQPDEHADQKEGEVSCEAAAADSGERSQSPAADDSHSHEADSTSQPQPTPAPCPVAESSDSSAAPTDPPTQTSSLDTPASSNDPVSTPTPSSAPQDSPTHSDASENVSSKLSENDPTTSENSPDVTAAVHTTSESTTTTTTTVTTATTTTTTTTTTATTTTTTADSKEERDPQSSLDSAPATSSTSPAQSDTSETERDKSDMKTEKDTTDVTCSSSEPSESEAKTSDEK